MKEWKVGIIGLSRGKGFVNVFGAHPRVKIAALCDLNQDALNKVGRAFELSDSQLFTDFEDFVNEPIDIVVIATPIRLHAEQTIKAMENGKHVLCEQTAAYTVEDCEKIVNTVKKTGKGYMMAENYCYFHYIREWKEMIARGKLGEIYYAEAEYVHEIVNLLVDEKTGKTFWRYKRPPIWYCAHCLGPLLTLMDDRIIKATGVHSGFNMFPDRSNAIGFLDMEVGLFRTQKGAVIKILRSQTARRYPHLVFYSLYGTKGVVENGRGKGDGLLYIENEMSKKDGARAISCPTTAPDAPEEAQKGGHGTSEYYMIRDFLDAVENNSKPPIDVIRSMDFTIPGIIAHEAAMRGGEWLDVPQFDW